MDGSVLLVLLILVIVLILSVFFRYVPLGLWITALASGVPVKISTLVGMRFRRIPPQKLVNAYIQTPTEQ